MKRLVFEQGAFDDFCDWSIYDRPRFIKIHELLKAILRDPFTNKPFVNFYATKRVGGQVLDSNAIKLLKIST